jgi:hypothetical protein
MRTVVKYTTSKDSRMRTVVKYTTSKDSRIFHRKVIERGGALNLKKGGL